MGRLRVILALAVVFSHSPWNRSFVFVGGQNAVQLFYMISGFLIAHILRANEAYQSPVRFYLNRALRIYPMYYAVALITLIGIIIANPGFFEIFRVIPGGASALLILSNILIFGQDMVMFTGVVGGEFRFLSSTKLSEILLYHGLLVPQAWSLGLELAFYLIAPYIIPRPKILFVLLGMSFITRAVLFSLGLGTVDPWGYRFFPAELSLFILGALCNIYVLPRLKSLLSQGRISWAPAAATQLLTVGTLVYSILPSAEAVKTIVLFITFLLLLPLTFLYQHSSPTDKFIGELSYPIYIGHYLMISGVAFLVAKLSLQPSAFALSLTHVIVAIVFAYILNRAVGKPVELLRARVRANR